MLLVLWGLMRSDLMLVLKITSTFELLGYNKNM